ncbi:MAG: SBBP repeat-containing protein, partial [Terriglobales bacterium]
ANAGGYDAFVAKLNPSGSALVYSTYLGGIENDAVLGIAVNSSGNAYVAGWTASTNFPTMNPLQAVYGGGSSNAFVANLNPSGSALVYSTYLGGSCADSGSGIAVDSSGNAYVTGSTCSTNFPTMNPLQAANAGGYDAFVAEINPSGSALVYSTYLGGSGDDPGTGIAVDGSGNAYVTGQTNSTNFPTMNPLQAANAGGNDDAFVAKLNASGSALIYSTYLGGSGADGGTGIAVDSSDNAYVTGYTASTDFPTMNPLQAAYGGGGYDTFVAEINPSGSALVYSTYLGGSGVDHGSGIAVDSTGNAYVTGYTASTDFPTMNPLQAAYGGGSDDAFVAKLNPLGSALVYSTYLGGSHDDDGLGIAVDSSGNAYATGQTNSTDFPTMNPLQPTNGGGYDVFVAKIGSLLSSATTIASSSNPSNFGQSVTFTATVTTSGSKTPTGTVTFYDGATALGTGTLNGSGIATYTTSSLAVGQHSMTAVYGGDANNAGSTSSVLTQTVNAADFTLTSNPTSATVTAGQSGTFTLTVTPQGSFTSPISFSCSGLPALAGCTFKPASVTPNSSTATSTLTITTTAQTASLASPYGRRSPLYAMWLVLPAVLLGMVGMAAPNRRKLLSFCLAFLLVGGCLLQAACGGGSNGGGGGGGGGTPPGTYTITVTGAAGSTQHTTAVTLTVQ